MTIQAVVMDDWGLLFGEDERRDEVISGLRALADLFQDLPELGVPMGIRVRVRAAGSPAERFAFVNEMARHLRQPVVWETDEQISTGSWTQNRRVELLYVAEGQAQPGPGEAWAPPPAAPAVEEPPVEHVLTAEPEPLMMDCYVCDRTGQVLNWITGGWERCADCGGRGHFPEDGPRTWVDSRSGAVYDLGRPWVSTRWTGRPIGWYWVWTGHRGLDGVPYVRKTGPGLPEDERNAEWPLTAVIDSEGPLR